MFIISNNFFVKKHNAAEKYGFLKQKSKILMFIINFYNQLDYDIVLIDNQ